MEVSSDLLTASARELWRCCLTPRSRPASGCVGGLRCAWLAAPHRVPHRMPSYRTGAPRRRDGGRGQRLGVDGSTSGSAGVAVFAKPKERRSPRRPIGALGGHSSFAHVTDIPTLCRVRTMPLCTPCSHDRPPERAEGDTASSPAAASFARTCTPTNYPDRRGSIAYRRSPQCLQLRAAGCTACQPRLAELRAA